MSFIPTAAIADQTAFVEGTTALVPVGGEWNDASATLTAGKVAAFRITEKRAAHVNLRNETGVELGTAAAPLKVDGSGATQPISGAVTVSNFPASTPVSGSVSVSNFPATQPISGAVSVSSLPSLPAGSAAIGAVTVSNLPATQPVSGAVSVSNLPATQPVSGAVSVSNFPATQPVSGAVSVSSLPGLAAGTNVIGKVLLYDGAGNAIASTSGALNVNISGGSLAGAVSVTNFPATQAVSAAALPLPAGASTAAKQPALGTAGTASADVITVQGIASGIAQPVSGSVAVSNLPATQPVSGALSVSNFPATQPVSGTVGVSSLPSLPAGSNNIGTVNLGSSPTIGVSGSVSITNFPGTQQTQDLILEAATGSAAAAIPYRSVQIAGSDGTYLRALLTDTTGQQKVLVTALPSLAAGSAAIGSVSVSNLPTTQSVSGTVSVSNFPATQPISGALSVSNFPATQTVAGSVAVTSLPALVAGTAAIGSVTVSGTVADSTLAAVIQANRATVEIGGPTAVIRNVVGPSGAIPLYTSCSVLIPAVTGKWIKVYAITCAIAPNAYLTSATQTSLVFEEGLTGAKLIWDCNATLPGALPATASIPVFGITAQTPSSFVYVTSVSGVAIGFGAAPNVTLGSSSGPIVIYVYYSYLSAAPF